MVALIVSSLIIMDYGAFQERDFSSDPWDPISCDFCSEGRLLFKDLEFFR